MFSNEVKSEYLDSLSMRKRVTAERLFRKTEQIEYNLGMDIGDMNADELCDTITACNPQTYIMAFEIRRIFMDYINWRNKKLDRSAYNAAEECNPLSICAIDDTVKEFRDFNDIYRCLLSVYKATDGMVCFPTACLAWIGLSSDEIAMLEPDDIDFSTGIIFVKGRKPSDLIECRQKLPMELLRIYHNTTLGERTQNRSFYVDLVDVGRFIKVPRTKNSQKANVPLTGSAIMQTVNTFFCDQYKRLYGKEISLTFDGIKMLGKINRLEELVRDYGDVDKIPSSKLYGYTQFSKTNWTIQMIEATLNSFREIHKIH